ncbi:hypothetical protein OAS39_12930 [Pirellulales bacterium]|nr:hypothetical protein [Pirellulales bacterium]
MKTVQTFRYRLHWIAVTQIMLVAAQLAVGTITVAEETRPRRLIYNSDGGNMFIYKAPPMTPEDVTTYVDEVAGTQVTTFFVCPSYCMPMMYPSRVTEMIGTTLRGEQWQQVQSAGLKPNGKRNYLERAIVNLHALVDAGHDPVGLVIQRAREKEMEVFLTFRINEIHDVQNPDSLLVSRFWRDHPEWHVGKIGDKISPLFREIIGGHKDHEVDPIVSSWFPGALNFSVPDVRAMRLAELRECCERYRIDGLDLDFQRFPIYFPQDEGPEHVETMTSWLREVREMTREVGKKRGQPLQLSARVLARPAQNLNIGLDPISWAKEGLVDFLVVSHYLRNDFPLPIAEYRSSLPEAFPVYGSIEVEPEPDTYRKIARQLWADGADGILLFNFFTTRERGKEPPFELLNELGKSETIRLAGQ